jgi:hypothetical protein
MTVFSLAAPLAHALHLVQPDEGTLALIALLAGMAGGWCLTEWHEQLKARRAKVERKPQIVRRKPD